MLQREIPQPPNPDLALTATAHLLAWWELDTGNPALALETAFDVSYPKPKPVLHWPPFPHWSEAFFWLTPLNKLPLVFELANTLSSGLLSPQGLNAILQSFLTL